MPFTLSNSSLNLMEECHRCFWLDKHKVWKRPAGIFPSLPAGMDSILKAHFDSYIGSGALPPELKRKLDSTEYQLFGDKALLDSWRNWRKGLRWEDSKGNALTGAIDNVLTRNEKLVVLDYKTRGYDLKEDTAAHYQNQLDIYAFLLEMNGHPTANYGFLLFYVPKRVNRDGSVVFETTLKRMPANGRRALRLFREAVALLDRKCPKKGCEWCGNVAEK